MDSNDCFLCKFILLFSPNLPRSVSGNKIYLAPTFEVLQFFLFEVDANVEQLAHRLFASLYYLWISYMLPIVRGYMITNTVLIVIPSILWIASIHVEYPRRLGLIWVALFFGTSATQRNEIR